MKTRGLFCVKEVCGEKDKESAMIDAMIRWSLHNRFVVVCMTVGLMVWGVVRMQQMPVDVFPDLTAPTVTVVTEAHGMAPEEVEQSITFPVESALHGASGVRRVRSSTSVGLSVVWVEFDWGQDVYTARQIVGEKMQLVQSTLPPQIDPPVMAPISSIMGEVMFIGLHGEEQDAELLRTLADRTVRRRLLAVPGVSEVVPIGGEVKQFQVHVRPHDLVRHDVSLKEVIDAIEATNENVSAGFYEHAGREHLIYGVGRVEGIDDIAETVIQAREEDVPLRVVDVADVAIGAALKRGDAGVSGEPGVVLGIQKQPGVNTVTLTQEIEEVLEQIEQDLPEGVVLEKGLLRQSDFIEASLDNVNEALRDGALLVMLIIGLFLWSGRATLITACAIPISLVVSVLVLDAMGATLNTMSLGGMAIAVGALVDDAIIDVENVVRRLRERSEQEDVLEVVYMASREIRGSIVFATGIIMLVFVPLFFLSGVEGRLLQPLGIAYVVSLAASLVTALTITPVLCALLLPHSSAVRRGEEGKVVECLRSRYDAALERVVDRWSMLLLVALVGVVGALWGVWHTGRDFLPSFNEGALTVSAVTLPGTSLEESNRLGAHIESILLSQPEIARTARRTGRAELDAHAQGINATEIEVPLQMMDRSEAKLLAALRQEFARLEGVNITIGQPISHRIDHMISGTRANIAVKIFGRDMQTLNRLAGQVKAEMASVPGVVDLSIEERAHLPVTTVRFDRGALTRYQLTVREVSETIEVAFQGRSVSQVLEGASAFDLVVMYPEREREDVQAVRQTMVRTPDGAWVPLEALAKIEEGVGINQIGREHGERKVVVMCNVGEGADLVSVVEAIRARVDSRIERPTGYYIEYGGQFEAAQQATRTLSWLGLLVIAGVFVLLFWALKDWRDASLVMLNLPLALIGGVVGVYLAGGVLSVASIIGFITLFGVATRNGIMLVTHIRYVHDVEGVSDAREAVLKGSSERLAPILMTALASGLGLLPLALAQGEPGSEIQAPMAIVILCGLGSSTLLNMFVVPAVMCRFGSLRRAAY